VQQRHSDIMPAARSLLQCRFGRDAFERWRLSLSLQDCATTFSPACAPTIQVLVKTKTKLGCKKAEGE
jgi:hypothetical protein